MSSARKLHEPSCDHWQPLDCDGPRAEGKGGRHRVLTSASDAFSGLEEDIATHLAWLALRLRCQPGDIIFQLSELLRSTQKELQKGLPPSTISTLRADMPTDSGKMDHSERSRIPPYRSNKLMETNSSPSFPSARVLSHYSGFSFLPGHDSINSIGSNAFTGQAVEPETKYSRPLAWQDTKQIEYDSSDELVEKDSSGAMAAGLRLQQRLIEVVESPTARLGVLRNPRRDGLGKPLPTVIVDSYKRSPSRSQRRSTNSNSEIGSLREDPIRDGNTRLAVAAARAAKKGAVFGHPFPGHSNPWVSLIAENRSLARVGTEWAIEAGNLSFHTQIRWSVYTTTSTKSGCYCKNT